MRRLTRFMEKHTLPNGSVRMPRAGSPDYDIFVQLTNEANDELLAREKEFSR